MLRQHDHHRVDPREMFGSAAVAAPRPAAANDRARLPAIGAKWVAAVPVGRGSARRRRSAASRGSSRARKREGGARVGWGLRHQRGEARRAIVEAQEQRRVVDLAPDEPALAVERRKAVEPLQLARRRVARQLGDPLGLAAQQIGAVEAGAGEEGLRRQGRRCAWRGRARRRGGRASEGPPRRSGRAAATSLRRAVRLPPTTVRSSAKWVKTWRSSASGAPSSGSGSSLHSGPGKAAIPPSIPRSGRRTSQTAPSRSIQRAMPWRSGRSRLAARTGKASGSPLAKAAQSALSGQAGQSGARGRQIVAPRSIIAWAKSPALLVRGHCVGQLADSWPRFGNRHVDRVEPGDDPLDIGVDHHRAPAERDRGDRRGGIGADSREARAARLRWSGSRPAPRPAWRRR